MGKSVQMGRPKGRTREIVLKFFGGQQGHGRRCSGAPYFPLAPDGHSTGGASQPRWPSAEREFSAPGFRDPQSCDLDPQRTRLRTNFTGLFPGEHRHEPRVVEFGQTDNWTADYHLSGSASMEIQVKWVEDNDPKSPNITNEQFFEALRGRVVGGIGLTSTHTQRVILLFTDQSSIEFTVDGGAPRVWVARGKPKP
jgi:hypothetical protein